MFKNTNSIPLTLMLRELREYPREETAVNKYSPVLLMDAFMTSKEGTATLSVTTDPRISEK